MTTKAGQNWMMCLHFWLKTLKTTFLNVYLGKGGNMGMLSFLWLHLSPIPKQGDFTAMVGLIDAKSPSVFLPENASHLHYIDFLFLFLPPPHLMHLRNLRYWLQIRGIKREVVRKWYILLLGRLCTANNLRSPQSCCSFKVDILWALISEIWEWENVPHFIYICQQISNPRKSHMEESKEGVSPISLWTHEDDLHAAFTHIK